MNPTSKNILYAVGASVITTIIIFALAMTVVSRNPSWAARFNTAAPQTSTSTLGSLGVVQTVKKVNPAVVSIAIIRNEPVDSYDPFGGLFNFPGQRNRERGTQRLEVGGGSGFLVSADGLIVTNQHVVSDTKAEYTVYTNDGKKHPAKVIARDVSQDIAVIKIDPEIGVPYPYVTFGSSRNLELGQTVITIGNALGEFRNTVSVGVVSGLSRSIIAGSVTGEIEELNEVIQTDAAINPGNSGGPLLDASGNVVGVNVATAIGSQSVGFALPADVVKMAVDSVKTKGYISRPFLGIRYTEITETLKQQNNLPIDYGVLVSRGQANEPAVVPGSPAAKAGITEGDIVLEFDGKKLAQDVKLSSLVRAKKVGDSVPVKLLRKGAQKNFTVTLEEYNK